MYVKDICRCSQHCPADQDGSLALDGGESLEHLGLLRHLTLPSFLLWGESDVRRVEHARNGFGLVELSDVLSCHTVLQASGTGLTIPGPSSPSLNAAPSTIVPYSPAMGLEVGNKG